MPYPPHRPALAVCAWLAAVIGLGAWSAHFLYNGGMALADVARRKPINGPIDALASLCNQASFADFHRFSIVFITALTALPWLPRLTRNPDGTLFREWTDARADLPGLRHAALAATLCAALAFATAMLFHGRSGIHIPTSWFRHATTALLSALLIEMIFRGVFQRTLSRTFSPRIALLATAATSFLFLSALSPHGIHSWTPVLSSERFPLLHSLASGFSDPVHLFNESLPLLLLGSALCWARMRTASLWLVIGIQTGSLLTWHITPHPIPTILAALATVYVFCGRPVLRPTTTT